MNSVNLVGRLGADPEVKYTANGMSVAKLNLAVSEKFKKNDELQEHTNWIPIECWGKTAEFVGNYLHKGDQIAVSGKLRVEKYEKDGTQRTYTKVVADRVDSLGGGHAKENYRQASAYNSSVGEGVDVEDIPF